MASRAVCVSKMFSPDLFLRDSANRLVNYLDRLPEADVEVDFTAVNSISRSFAHQYITDKNLSKKKITEKNVPENVKKMFTVVAETPLKTSRLNLASIRMIAL